MSKVKLVIFAIVCSLIVLIIGITKQKNRANTLEENYDATVLIVSPDGSQGTGVVFINRDYTFVWTDAHVVSGAMSRHLSFDSVTGLPKVTVGFSKVTVVQFEYQDGMKVSECRHLAEIVRFSEKNDIALLRILKADHFKQSVKFLPEGAETAAGDDVYHVGCMSGARGFNSISKGIIANVGRWRMYGVANDENGILYDQVSMIAQKGSSGGGIFDKQGRCIGLITEYLRADTPGSFCYTPMRRLREYAKEVGVEFAITTKKKVNQDNLYKNYPVYSDNIAIPQEILDKLQK